MPSPIPNLNYIQPNPAAVENPGAVTQVGCVYCLRDEVYAPASVIYQWAGYSLCMTHAKEAIKAAQPAQ